MTASGLRLGTVLPGLLLLCAGFLSACQEQNPEQVFQGYVEGEYVEVAAPLAGELATLDVSRGAQVRAGDLLFTLEREEQRAEVAAAGQELRRAESRLADLGKGERPSELAALRSRLAAARSAYELSRNEFARREELFGRKIISREELDRARTAQERDQAALSDLQAQLDTARLGGRADVVAAARAEVATARARLRKAEWALAQKSRRAAQAALVFDTLFEPGEFVPAGYPVVSLLPPEHIKLRFFVPESLIGSLRIGQRLAVTVDGTGGPLRAAISYIAPQAEYTPPVIFSRETRAKLVFLVEARPDPSIAARLHPGQPVDVRLEPDHE
jgi:HlyD family secretion protein